LIRRDVIFDETCIPSTKSSSFSPTSSSIHSDQTSEENLDEMDNEESFESCEEEIVPLST
jgi:hypothetical protein